MSWGGKNKRHFSRVEFPCTVHIEDSSKISFFGAVEDLSRGGVRIVSKKKLRLFEDVSLESFDKDNGLHVKGKVVWVKGKGRAFAHIRFFEAGIEFPPIA